MLADMFTKPLQGVAFRWFRSTILNLPDTNELCPAIVPMPVHRSVLGNESTTEWIMSGNGHASKLIELEGSQKMNDLMYAMERMAENNVGKQRVS